MLRSLLSGNFDLLLFILRVPCILIALTFHEVAHGYAAYKLGDPTAHARGRLSLNPIHHLDPIGTLSMLLFGFGWAKPVPIDARYFKKPKRDMALTALAGPAMNLILCFFGILLYRVFLALFIQLGIPNAFVYRLQLYTLEFFQLFAYMNVYLAVFNLIPVPPLDGSRLLLAFLPAKYYFGLMRYEQYISLALMLLLFTGWLSAPLSLLSSAIVAGFEWIIGLIPFL